MNNNQEIKISRISFGDIVYFLDEENKTAHVLSCVPNISEIIIPRSIKYKTNEYIVMSILEHAFISSEIKSIRFVDDSELKTIEKEVFCDTKIESLSIPSKLIDLKEGWCQQTPKLNNIKVSDTNPRYCCLDGQIIIGKSSIEQENYDELVFCSRNVETIIIPDSIERICSYAFSLSLIESISIPSQITRIGKGAFYLCNNLKRVEISNDSKLEVIEEDAFYETSIENFTIPSKLVELKEGWCGCTSDLNEIKISPNNPYYCFIDKKFILKKSELEKEDYDELVFCVRNVEAVKIPSFIKHINSCAFYGCESLENIEIPDDSNLMTIGKHAFTFSPIKSIKIPSSVTQIEEGAFYACEQLQQIEISHDSKLTKIEKDVFTGSIIKRITIPSGVTLIGEDSFFNCLNLARIEIESDSKLQFIDKEAFFQSSIESLVIPTNVTYIGKGAFARCKKLQIIEINDNSKIEYIDDDIFNDNEYIISFIDDVILMISANLHLLSE